MLLLLLLLLWRIEKALLKMKKNQSSRVIAFAFVALTVLSVEAHGQASPGLRLVGPLTGTNTFLVDAAGNVYATGTFINRVDFDPGPGTFWLSSVPGGNDTSGVRDGYVLKLTQSLFNQGVVTRDSVLRADVELAQVKQLLVSAESAVQIAAAGLNFAMGRNASLPVDVVLPEPCKPTIIMTLGGSFASRSFD